MKKISVLLLVSLLLISVVACGKEKDTTASVAASTEKTSSDSNVKASDGSLDGAGAVLGKLYFIEDRDKTMTQLSLSGNLAGSEEFNT